MNRGKLLMCLSICLMTFLASTNSYAGSVTDIVGGWRLINQPGTNSVFTFTSSGQYFNAEDQVPPGTPGGQNGMERGTYAWNPSTGSLQYSTLVNTNGQWGLSSAANPITALVNGNTLTFSGGSTFSRLISSTNPLVGSWTFGDRMVLSFAADGTYFHAEDQAPPGSPGGQNGMERGTYTWNPLTGAFSRTTLVDTNGQWGLSSSSITTVQVDGNVLRVFDTVEGVFELNRVVAVPLPPGLSLMLGGLGMFWVFAKRSRKG
jgi:hypothetical protein